MELIDFKHGIKVKYIPTHADGNSSHTDCQFGVVSSVNGYCVFVKYDNASCKMVTGDEPYTAQGTSPKDLIILGE